MSTDYNNSLEQGVNGSDVISDTSLHNGKWGVLVVADDAVISALTCTNKTNTAGLVGVSLASGYSTYGFFDSITLTSGVVEMYTRY
jgi:hypothetical protein